MTVTSDTPQLAGTQTLRRGKLRPALRVFGLRLIRTTIVFTASASMLLLSVAAAADASTDPSDWPTYNHDSAGSRASDEHLLSPDTVAGLQVKWQVPLPGTAYGTPAVVGHTVYAGDTSGAFYARDAETGAARWTARANSPITDSPLVTPDVAIFGDYGGSIHGLRRDSGVEAWPPLRPNPGPFANIQSSPVLVNQRRGCNRRRLV